MQTEVENALELRLALKRFAPDLAIETRKQMGLALSPLVTKAKGFIPADTKVLSGWVKPLTSGETRNYRPFPKFNSFEAKKGIGYKTTPSRPNKLGFVGLARIFNASAPGAIFEVAGRKNLRGQKSAVTLSRKYGTGFKGKNLNNSNNPNAGEQFITNLNSAGTLVSARPKGLVGRPSRKQTGRVIFRAFAEDNGVAVAAVLKAIEIAKDKFETRMAA